MLNEYDVNIDSDDCYEISCNFDIEFKSTKNNENNFIFTHIIHPVVG